MTLVTEISNKEKAERSPGSFERNAMTDVNEILRYQPVLLFDGECGFCNRTVQFFLRNERRGSPKMHFAPLQSEEGLALRKFFEIDDNPDSLILIKGHSAYIKSCAALRLTPYMKGLWPAMILFVIIPPLFATLYTTR